MIDTTAINFGIQKLAQAFNTAAPHLQNVSAEYVRFVVAKAVLLFPVMLIVTLVLLGIFVFFKSKLRDWEEGAIVGMVFSGVAALICFIGFICMGYDAALAIWCPEMFTINQIIGAAK